MDFPLRPRLHPFAVLLLGIWATGCRSADATGPAAEPPTGGAVHRGPAPIDCPLRAAGIDADHLRPFAEVADYVAFLERADRASWQRPDQVVAALGLRGDETVVDLGAGSGYFSFRLAAALPEGLVVAADTEPEMVRHVHHRAMQDGIANLRATLVDPDDPALGAGADLVFVCDVLHHVTERETWLRKLAARKERGARLAMIEFAEGPLPEGPPEVAKIGRSELLGLATAAGLSLVADCSDLLPYQTFFLFMKTTAGPDEVLFRPIGRIHSPFTEQAGTPIQPTFAGPVRGRIQIDEPYRAALADLEGFDRVWLVYHFDRARAFVPKVIPYRDSSQERGLFATRAPARPNPIGMSAVRLVRIESDGIVVEEIDVLDGTPLLDLKPYVPAFDAYPAAKAGWLDEARDGREQADDRFVRPDRR
jgi:tRNA-Thr(GGU) m(6)t(6)A37 methyltransferase TsaA